MTMQELLQGLQRARIRRRQGESKNTFKTRPLHVEFEGIAMLRAQWKVIEELNVYMSTTHN